MAANLFVDQTKPWLLVKDPQSTAALDASLHAVFEVLRISSIMLQPVIPDITEHVLTTLNVEQRNWADAELRRNDEVALQRAQAPVFARLKT